MGAGARAPPRELTRLLQDANAAADHAGASLALTTHAANNVRDTVWRPDGTATTVARRDAWLPPYWDRGTGSRSKATGRRRPPQPAQPNDPAHEEQAALETAAREKLLHAKGAGARARGQARLQQATAEGRGFQAWLADKAKEPASGRPPDQPSAQERLEALRRRVAEKAANAELL